MVDQSVRRCVVKKRVVVGCGQEEERFFLSCVVLGSKRGMPWKGSGSSCFEDKAQEIVE